MGCTDSSHLENRGRAEEGEGEVSLEVYPRASLLYKTLDTNYYIISHGEFAKITGSNTTSMAITMGTKELVDRVITFPLNERAQMP